MLLKNKTAVITGCNRGIGKSILEVFARNGAKIFACVRNIDKKFKEEISLIGQENKCEIIPIELDLNSPENIDLSVKSILEDKDGNKIDILINNAGVIESSLFQMTKIDSLKKIFEINFFSVSKFTQLIVKSVIKNKKGSIVYISSSSGIDNNTGRNAYSASKAAIISQAHTLSRELGRYNIRVNSIAPGLTDTRMMNENTPTKILDEKVSTLSLNRIASPEEIANVALFLSSDLSTYVTGQVIRVDGGM